MNAPAPAHGVTPSAVTVTRTHSRLRPAPAHVLIGGTLHHGPHGAGRVAPADRRHHHSTTKWGLS